MANVTAFSMISTTNLLVGVGCGLRGASCFAILEGHQAKVESTRLNRNAEGSMIRYLLRRALADKCTQARKIDTDLDKF